jgi:membrane peptidoglycan carboxypeptidase
MMVFTTNTHPAPQDSRHLSPHEASCLYRPVRNDSTQAPGPGPQADAIRDEVLAKLKAAGIYTDGKTDAALLADYTQMLRDQAGKQQEPAKAEKQAQNSALNEFAGYSINSLIDEGAK